MLQEELKAKAERVRIEAAERGFIHSIDQVHKKLGYPYKHHVVALAKKNFVENEDWTMCKALAHKSPDLYYLTQSCLERMLILSRSRQLNKVQLNINVNACNLQWVKRYEPAGVECISFLCQSLAGIYKTMPEHRVGPYRIDLFIVDLNIAIECDEGGHAAYDNKKEAQRTDYIEKSLIGIKWIRFNPDLKDFKIATVLNRILHFGMEHSCTAGLEKLLV